MADRYRTIARPPEDAGIPEVAHYHRHVARQLEEIGVDYGEEFVVVKASEFNSQPSLTESQLGPFARDSETSRQAAIDNYPREGGQRRAILSTFAAQIPSANFGSYKGYTRDELETITKLSGNAIRPRVKELIEGGYLEESDDVRLTRAGSEATVLQITELGRRVFLPETSTHDNDNQ